MTMHFLSQVVTDEDGKMWVRVPKEVLKYQNADEQQIILVSIHDQYEAFRVRKKLRSQRS